MAIIESFKTELKSRNFSIYGQWTGIITIFLCLALGIANIFHFSIVILFSVIAIVQGLVLVFVEIPFLLKICPMSERFVNIMSKFNQNWPRAGFYFLNAVIQYLSIIPQATSLIVLAIFFTIGAIFYALAAFKKQEFQTSQTFGAQNVVREIL